LASITELINAYRESGTLLLQGILAPYNITYQFYPGRDTLPSKLRTASAAEIQRFARDTANPAEERLPAILWCDVEGDGGATKAMMYRFVETLLQVLARGSGDGTVYTLLF